MTEKMSIKSFNNCHYLEAVYKPTVSKKVVIPAPFCNGVNTSPAPSGVVSIPPFAEILRRHIILQVEPILPDT